MTTTQFKQALAESGAVIIPLGSVEELGPHGPLGADLYVAEEVSRKLGERTNSLVAPAIPYGDTAELDFWPGTVSVDTPTLTSLYLSVARSFVKHGAKEILFLITHSLNLRAADAACRILQAGGNSVCVIDWWRTVSEEAGDLIQSGSASRGHGGEMITSVVMAVRPEGVDIAAAVHEEPREDLAFFGRHGLNSGSPFRAYGDFRDYCESGAWGDVSTASAEKGRLLIERALVRIAAFVAEFRKHHRPKDAP